MQKSARPKGLCQARGSGDMHPWKKFKFYACRDGFSLHEFSTYRKNNEKRTSLNLKSGLFFFLKKKNKAQNKLDLFDSCIFKGAITLWISHKIFIEMKCFNTLKHQLNFPNICNGFERQMMDCYFDTI